jgi:sarcosine oxidase subunit beta
MESKHIMSTVVSEIVVVGCGVMGSSIAYHLAKCGIHVHMIEREQIAVAPAASWASAGGVRRQGRHPAEAQLASEAIERWPLQEEELAADLHYRRGGNLLLAETEDEAAQLVSFVQQQREMGFADVRLIDRQESLALVPGLNDRVLAGSYSARDGQADPALTTRAFAAAAVRLGATCWQETAVLSLIHQDSCVLGVRTTRGDVQAGQVILTAGAWSDELMQDLGIRLPIRTAALQMLLSSPAPEALLRPVLSSLGRSLSLKQLFDGSFLIGGGWPGDPSTDRRTFHLRRESIEGNWATACGLFPAVGRQQVARSWCGLEAESIDGIPFIGSFSGLQGLTIALGFSGHGFALSPAVGRSVADHIAGQPTPELDGLRPDRIFGFSAEQVNTFMVTQRPAGAG